MPDQIVIYLAWVSIPLMIVYLIFFRFKKSSQADAEVPVSKKSHRDKSRSKTEYLKPPVNTDNHSADELCDLWSTFSEEVRYILAIYDRGKNRVVDVLSVEDAEETDHKIPRVSLIVAAPKVVKHRDVDDWLEWEKDFNLPLQKLIYFEPLGPDFYEQGIPKYQSTVERGLKIAKTLE